MVLDFKGLYPLFSGSESRDVYSRLAVEKANKRLVVIRLCDGGRREEHGP